MSLDSKNKIFLSVFVLIVGMYISTALHEIGHHLVLLSYGCHATPYVAVPIPYGGNFHATCPTEEIARMVETTPWMTLAGPLFVGLAGIILCLGYHVVSFVKNHFVSTILFYFISFACLANAAAQLFFGSGDYHVLIHDCKVNPLFVWAGSAFFLLILFGQIIHFKNMLRIVFGKTLTRGGVVLGYISFVFVLGIFIITYIFASFYYPPFQ